MARSQYLYWDDLAATDWYQPRSCGTHAEADPPALVPGFGLAASPPRPEEVLGRASAVPISQLLGCMPVSRPHSCSGVFTASADCDYVQTWPR